VRAFCCSPTSSRQSSGGGSFKPFWWWTLVHFSGEQRFSTADILHTFCRITTKFGSVRGLSNRHLFPEFVELWSLGHQNIEGCKMCNAFLVHRFAECDEIWHNEGHWCVAGLKAFNYQHLSLSLVLPDSALKNGKISGTVLQTTSFMQSIQLLTNASTIIFFHAAMR